MRSSWNPCRRWAGVVGNDEGAEDGAGIGIKCSGSVGLSRAHDFIFMSEPLTGRRECPEGEKPRLSRKVGGKKSCRLRIAGGTDVGAAAQGTVSKLAFLAGFFHTDSFWLYHRASASIPEAAFVPQNHCQG